MPIQKRGMNVPYTALYRKYRPISFDTVVGQEHIVKTLKNQLISNRVSHAYLFCGTRGTGKTSTAKIFARAINCERPKPDGEPCNECSMCQAALNGRSLNVIEIDAASNNGVDNIREIREEVKYPPTQGKYKVYIIDEVHMLSAGAFNALLKTLEEPPAHVVFLLATTDPQKVPPTILSRVQRYDFRRITAQNIAQTLKGYLQQEKISIQEEAIAYIARLGDGSMRDSLSILDQCIAFDTGETITKDFLLDLMGAVDQKIFFDMAEAILHQDAKAMMDLVEEMILQGRDVLQFVMGMVTHFRNLLLSATISDCSTILDLSSEGLEDLKKQAQTFQPEELIHYVSVFSNLQSELKYASNQRVLLEVELLRICCVREGNDNNSIAARLAAVERKLAEGIGVSAAPIPEKKTKIQQPVSPKQSLPISEVRKRALQEWASIKESFEAPIKYELVGVELNFKGEQDKNWYLVCNTPFLEKVLSGKIQQIAEHIKSKLGLTEEISLKTIGQEEYDLWQQKNQNLTQAIQEEEENEDFESLMHGYFPEADYQ